MICFCGPGLGEVLFGYPRLTPWALFLHRYAVLNFKVGKNRQPRTENRNMACIFCNIIRGEMASKKVYEDDRAYAFEDIRPQAPTHVLIIPKKHIVDVKNAKPEDEADIGHLFLVAAKLARERGIEDGYRTVFNVGPRAGQSVFHLHLHLLGGRDLRWPPG